jgi:hypothetical protein
MSGEIRKLARACWIALIILILFAWNGIANAQSCESGHWIEAVLDDGRLVKLEDGSLWEVDSVDVITSSLWLPVSDIVVCDDKLINSDDNESVTAHRIR